MTDATAFNQSVTESCSSLPIYAGEMTLLLHDGSEIPGAGVIEFFCGGGRRHFRVEFDQGSGVPVTKIPGSADGSFGSGTAHVRIRLVGSFFLFVTSVPHEGRVVGETRLISSDRSTKVRTIDLFILNSLIPQMLVVWATGQWTVAIERTTCSYSLSRVSLPIHEINLTHKLTIGRTDGSEFSPADVDAVVRRILLFLSFANCSRINAPVAYGRADSGIVWVQFEAPTRTLPTNRRSWATKLPQEHLSEAFQRFMACIENPFWESVFERGVNWQGLAELASNDSTEQGLFTVQMLLEMLSYVVLVEDAAVLGEDGYGKLPAGDRITLLCSASNQSIGLKNINAPEAEKFCAANSIRNVGELIAALRNKLIHPTKKNREYIESVPGPIRAMAIDAGLQIASLAILRIINYRGSYFDTSKYEVVTVPWAS